MNHLLKTLFIFFILCFSSIIFAKGDSITQAEGSSTLTAASKKEGKTFKDLEEVLTYIKASNTEAGDRFGYSLTLSRDGNTLAVGAPYEDSQATGVNGDQKNNEAENSGAVYVFTKNENQWNQQAYIKASNTEAYDWFGFPLTLSDDGNTLAVGALYEDSQATGVNGDQKNNEAESSGAVYVFTKNGNQWNQQAYIKASNTEAYDWFGFSLILSGDGNTLAVGALYEDSQATGVNGDQKNNEAESSGAVYVFTKNGNQWNQQAYIKASNTEALDDFGNYLTLSDDGNTLAVGAPYEDSQATGVNGDQKNNEAESSGAVYVFTKNGNQWNQQAYIKASNTEAEDLFGNFLTLSGDGNTLAVGAPDEDSQATGVNGDQKNNEAAGSGAVYVFTKNGNQWNQQTYIKASNTEAENWFGFSLTLSDDGNILAVGTDLESSQATGINGDQKNNEAKNSEAVYVFTKNGNQWNQQTYIKASNTEAENWFGFSLILSGDGNTLAVGAPYKDSQDTEVNGDQKNNEAKNSGVVYIYSR